MKTSVAIVMIDKERGESLGSRACERYFVNLCEDCMDCRGGMQVNLQGQRNAPF